MDEKPKPGSLKTTFHELVLEKFFDEFITVWYRERIIGCNVYDKARREIDILKDKKTNKTKKMVEKNVYDTSTVKRLPPSSLHSQSDLQSGKRKGVPADFNSANKWTSDRSKNVESRLEHDLQLQNKELVQKVEHLKDKVHEIRASAHYDLKEKDDQIEKLKKHLESGLEYDLQLQNKELLQKVNHLKQKVYGIRADAHYDLKEKDDQIEKLKKHLENLREQNKDLSKRLSKLSGDERRQGNPDLAELSDRYRPTEIGKMFSEVYDNEWSDAYENISRMDEDKKVGILHGIVTKAFNFCDKKFNEQTMTVRTTLLGLEQESAEDDRPDNESQSPQVGNKTVHFTNIQDTLKNVRKELAMETAGNIAQQFTPTLGQYVSGFGIKPNAIDKTLRIYAAKCVELCWLMAVCDPPMALSEDKIGNPYDFNIYKPYTRSMKDLKNPVLKLAIWPALRLHLGGSLVAKGVAQPGEGKSKQ